jgi:hypothetical protein
VLTRAFERNLNIFHFLAVEKMELHVLLTANFGREWPQAAIDLKIKIGFY